MTAQPNGPTGAKPMLDFALEYLALGYPIFPICSPAMGYHEHWDPDLRRQVACGGKKLGKTPMIRWLPYQTTLPTEIDVRGWWTRWSAANIAMATGRLSQIVVLDTDSGDAKKLAMGLGGLDQTPAVFTGQPGGTHFWMAHPGEEVSNFARKRPGLDFRGDGGYVLLPPSLHASGARYRWVDSTIGLRPAPIPDWLHELLQSGPATSDGDGGEALDLDAIINGVPEGGRDDAMWRLACKLRNDGVERRYADLIVRQAARACSPPFDEEIALGKVARAWQVYQPEPTFTARGSQANEAAAEATEPAGSAYPYQTLADLLLARPETAPCIVDGILWRGRCHWVFSDPGVGKTLFFLAVLLHVAAGRPFCGRTTRQGSVLIIEEDSPLTVLAEYSANLMDMGELRDGLPVYMNKLTGLRLTNQAGYDALMHLVNSLPEKPSIVMLDASERLVPSDKYSSKELDWLARFIQWCVSEDITIVIIDHTNKEKLKKGDKPADPMDRLFGARAKSAISDIMLYIAGSVSKGELTATFRKFRGDYPPNLVIGFQREDGFSIAPPKASVRSEAEQRIMRFFNSAAPDWYGSPDIMNVTKLKERTCRIALGALTERGILLREGGSKNTRYRRNPNLGSVFG